MTGWPKCQASEFYGDLIIKHLVADIRALYSCRQILGKFIGWAGIAPL